MSVTDAWIEHASALTLDDQDKDVDLGIVPGRFYCYTDDHGFGCRAGSEVTLEDALAWFARIGMPPKLKLSGYDAARAHRIERWTEGRIGCWLRCENCERATTTGLCGCGDEDPFQIGTFVRMVSHTGASGASKESL